jgi:hypothetical protein
MRFSRAIILFSLALTGCGQGVSDAPKLAECKGKVTYNGNPVAGANITFIVEKRPIATGTTNANGEFLMTTGGRKGAPVGTAKVGIIKSAKQDAPTQDMKPDDMRKMQIDQMGKKDANAKPEIPTKYANATTSGLTAEISENITENDFVFPLVD